MRHHDDMTTAVPPWNLSTLTQVAAVLSDTHDGLTGSQIENLLIRLKMADPLPTASKRDRLLEAFIARQNTDQHPRRIITFITWAMNPANYRERPHLFTLRQDRLNEILTFAGLRVTDKGEVAYGAVSKTLDEASRIATSLRDELRRRNTHPEVLRYCTIEVLKKANFHAELEACKSVFERLRQLTGDQRDGSALVDGVLALGQSGMPRVAINTLHSPTERDEQKGFANLVKGLASMYRNPTAHDPRANRTIIDDELLELLTTLSMIHRRLDSANLHP